MHSGWAGRSAPLSRSCWTGQSSCRGGSWSSSCVQGRVLGFLGVYEPFARFAGGGASVPLLGFGNTLWNGVKEAVEQEGFTGIFLGGFTASAAGISAALIFGYLASLVFEPKMKK